MLASDILQRFLDQMGEAVMKERFEPYSAGVRLPLVIRTSTATLTVKTIDELQDGFDDFTDMLRSRGCTGMIRVVMEASFEGPDTIVGIYETNLIDGERHVVPRFYSKMRLHRHAGVWQADEIQNTTRDDRWPMLMCRVESAEWPPKEFDE